MNTVFSSKFWRIVPKALCSKYPFAVMLTIVVAIALSLSFNGLHTFHMFVPITLAAVLGVSIFIALRNYERTTGRRLPLIYQLSAMAVIAIECLYFYTVDITGIMGLLGFVPILAFLIIVTFSHYKSSCDAMISHACGTLLSGILGAVGAFLSLLFALVAFLLLYGPLTILTDIDFPKSLFIFVIFFFPTITFIGVILLRESFHMRRKNNSNLETENFFAKLMLSISTYVSLVMVLYIVIILCRFELPRGYLSMVVTIITLFSMVTYCVCGKEWLKKQSNSWQKIHKAIPWLLLPMQVIMTIAIARRMSEYGVTITRVYGLILNIWFYAMCLYLALSKNPRRRILTISATITLFIATVSPLNVREYVEWQLKYDIEHNRGRVDDKKCYLDSEFDYDYYSSYE